MISFSHFHLASLKKFKYFVGLSLHFFLVHNNMLVIIIVFKRKDIVKKPHVVLCNYEKQCDAHFSMDRLKHAYCLQK